MDTKYCPRCGEEKAINDFGKQAKSRDGLYPYCKECKKEENKKYRQTNAEFIKQAKRRSYWRNVEYYRKYFREYQSGNFREYWKSYMKKHHELGCAHSKVALAVKKGLIKKSPCEECGKEDAEAHHDDYSKPLEVRWLCHKCHMEWHRFNKAKH